ncbi:MAG: hypothetical protein R2867_39315 [Caldilineaceae bacterium]
MPILLSHQQHYDNLITPAACSCLWCRARLHNTRERCTLNGNTQGLESWQTVELDYEAGETIRITGMPAVRHEPRSCVRRLGRPWAFV